MKVGTHTVLLSDLVRYTTTKAATVLGELGMDVTTGRPSGFIGGVDSPLAALSDIVAGSQSLFTFTHITGGVSTGALGFTPRFAIYTGIADGGGSGDSRSGHAVITGTGTDARTAGQNGVAPYADGSSVIQVFDGAATRSLDVTAFGAGGITLTWDSAITSHTGYLLVVG